MPATSIFIKAASSAISGIGYSRISVLLGPVRTAASTFSTTAKASYNRRDLVGTLGGGIGRSSAIFRRFSVGAMMLQSFQKRPDHVAALDRVREWTRARFKLPDDAAILVAEVSCAVPGCPPLETVVAFWTENETRHQFKLFKPVAAVVPD